MEDFKPIEYRWNNYDNPSSNMRLNKKYLKDLLLVCDFAINSNEALPNIKEFAKILLNRTTVYCKEHYKKAFKEYEKEKKRTFLDC